MKKTVKIHLSILLTLILLFLPIGNISVIQAASNKSLNEVKNYISSQDNSTISVSDVAGNKYSILYDKKKDTLSFCCDITNDGVSIAVKMTCKGKMKGKADISVAFKTEYSTTRGTAKKKISKLGLSSTKFKTQIEGVNGKDSDIQSLMNNVLDFSLSVWQKLLIYKTDYRLKDIGFKKLKKLKVAKVKTGANAENQPSYDNEEQVIHHDGEWTCDDCGAKFTTEYVCNCCGYRTTSYNDIISHGNGSFDCLNAGYTSHTTNVTITDQEAWDETVTVQVPHTKTKFSDGVSVG